MKLARIQLNGRPTAALVEGSSVIPLTTGDGTPAVLSTLLAAPDIASAVAKLGKQSPVALEKRRVVACGRLPEVWAAGVTYKRSQTARMEESEAAASCYDRVYTAARPEIFFKATPGRCSGHLGPLRIRVDATWNVPEPELALVINPSGRSSVYDWQRYELSRYRGGQPTLSSASQMLQPMLWAWTLDHAGQFHA